MCSIATGSRSPSRKARGAACGYWSRPAPKQSSRSGPRWCSDAWRRWCEPISERRIVDYRDGRCGMGGVGTHPASRISHPASRIPHPASRRSGHRLLELVEVELADLRDLRRDHRGAVALVRVAAVVIAVVLLRTPDQGYCRAVI